MAKSKVSSDFVTFQQKNSHKFEDAKTAEKQTRGIPMPVGTTGVAVIVDARADRAKSGEKRPYVAVEISVIEPEQYKGQKVTGAIHVIFDSEAMTAADRWAMMLDDLENMGLSRETREQHGDDIAACFDELLNEPHYVTFEVKEGYKGRKEIQCFATAPPAGVSSERRCEYMGVEYEILSGPDEDGNLHLRNAANPDKERTVSEDAVKML